MISKWRNDKVFVGILLELGIYWTRKMVHRFRSIRIQSFCGSEAGYLYVILVLFFQKFEVNTKQTNRQLNQQRETWILIKYHLLNVFIDEFTWTSIWFLSLVNACAVHIKSMKMIQKGEFSIKNVKNCIRNLLKWLKKVIRNLMHGSTINRNSLQSVCVVKGVFHNSTI